MNTTSLPPVALERFKRLQQMLVAARALHRGLADEFDKLVDQEGRVQISLQMAANNLWRGGALEVRDGRAYWVTAQETRAHSDGLTHQDLHP